MVEKLEYLYWTGIKLKDGSLQSSKYLWGDRFEVRSSESICAEYLRASLRLSESCNYKICTKKIEQQKMQLNKTDLGLKLNCNCKCVEEIKITTARSM